MNVNAGGNGAARVSAPRRYRLTSRLTVAVSIGLAALVALLFNGLAAKIVWRRDFSRAGLFRLSGQTVAMLEGLKSDVLVTVLMRPSHELANHVRDLLREYEYVSPRIGTVFLDSHRDLTRVRELAEPHGLRESNIILFESGRRRRVVDVEAIAEFDYLPVLAGGNRRMKAFYGESAFSAAIHAVSDAAAPVIYYLRGHGERDLNDTHPVSGYSAMARLIRDEQADLRELRLAESGGIPADAAMVMLAGPRRRLAGVELELLARYLDNQGRLLLLLDDAGSGIEAVLSKWGLALPEGKVGGVTLSGSELFVADYGEHPITRNLRGITTVFYRPRPVLPVERAAADGEHADRPRVAALARGRAIVDEAGLPVERVSYGSAPPVAVAVEKGLPSGIDVRLRPTRLVVFGDTDFVSNAGMVAGNAVFLVNAVNWLLERDARMEIAPRRISGNELLLRRDNFERIRFYTAVAIPACFLILGLAARLGGGRRQPHR